MNTSPYNYLRLSLTDRCNFNCFYCQPAARRDFLSKRELLSTSELLQLAQAFVKIGVRHVRLTGGEPLLRDDVSFLLEGLSQLDGLECLSLTTNGFYLASFLNTSASARLKKVNVSLDTLKPGRFRQLTGVDAFRRVREGIAKARQRSFLDVKVNAVLIRGFNDDEVLDFARFSHAHGIDVRFIELFKTTPTPRDFAKRFVPSAVIMGELEKEYGELEFLGEDPLAGPAEYCRIPGRQGRIGFIRSVTGFFCTGCNRLRLTADGKLYPCLYAGACTDLKKVLRQDDAAACARAIEEVMSSKSRYNKETCTRSFEMSSMGG